MSDNPLDDFDPPEGWDPEEALIRAVNGEEVPEAEKETATLLLAALMLMRLGMSYDEATEHIDTHTVRLVAERHADRVTFNFEFERETTGGTA